MTGGVKPAVFLDRDGVLAKEKSYVLSVNELEILPYTAECIRQIHKKGYYAVVITNQSGIARGLFTEAELAEMNDRLMKETYTELDYETRMNLFVEAEKVLVDDMPILPVFFYTDTMLVKPEVTGVLKCYIGHVFFQYADIVE